MCLLPCSLFGGVQRNRFSVYNRAALISSSVLSLVVTLTVGPPPQVLSARIEKSDRAARMSKYEISLIIFELNFLKLKVVG